MAMNMDFTIGFLHVLCNILVVTSVWYCIGLCIDLGLKRDTDIVMDARIDAGIDIEIWTRIANDIDLEICADSVFYSYWHDTIITNTNINTNAGIDIGIYADNNK